MNEQESTGIEKTIVVFSGPENLILEDRSRI